ncbi:MAG: 16S rRNA (adenine(1518)-N(6)/adenine(1519)-N(6))-dimethyltransferase RsmA [Gemmatimonadota bacterium]|nr:16S rRNA (adenine(1518)-N(6)/adenine(1519)-N(6))-dimethyltransferase RsmA [Gemmatimonadota bacterium]
MAKPNKGLAQHFLTDLGAVRRIVGAAGVGADDLVVEIGPGRGALTGRLLAQAGTVIGIERDGALCDLLRSRFGRGLHLRNRDVLTVDFSDLIRGAGFDHAILVGNLPYYITGAVIQRILDARRRFKRAVLTVQREVARRIAATPGNRDYGVLSIAVQLYSDPKTLFDLAPDVFNPAPRVFSSVIRLDFQRETRYRIQDERFFFRVVRTAFGQRRKMLKNALLGMTHGRMEILQRVGAMAEIDFRLRPEAVSIPEYERISRALKGFATSAGSVTGADSRQM